jgi:tRNA(Ile)-lysidine synthase
VTIDHGLQPGSAGRADGVAAQLRGLGLDPVAVSRVEVGSAGGPEAAARSARYAALDAAAQRFGAVAVLLGHSLDDQAETVLLGLARGSGARSLAGMAVRNGIYHRPLLGLRRATMRDACTADGITVWDDPHNENPAYARVRVRHMVLPMLERELGPGIAEALARTAGLLRDDADALDEIAQRYAGDCLTADGGLDCPALAGLTRAVRRRIILRAARSAGCPGSELSERHVSAIEALVLRWHGQGPVDLPGDVRAWRRQGRLFVRSC